MKTEFKGGILQVRELEDSIRATRKYTKGAFNRQVTHPPVQGADFPSRVITEYYEVYPEMEINWEMLAADAWAWVWGDTPHIDLRFSYDYRANRAKVTIYGGPKSLHELERGIPGFAVALAGVINPDEVMETITVTGGESGNNANHDSAETKGQTMGCTTGDRVGIIAHPQ